LVEGQPRAADAAAVLSVCRDGHRRAQLAARMIALLVVRLGREAESGEGGWHRQVAAGVDRTEFGQDAARLKESVGRAEAQVGPVSLKVAAEQEPENRAELPASAAKRAEAERKAARVRWSPASAPAVHAQ
jgi:hypothetical protein